MPSLLRRRAPLWRARSSGRSSQCPSSRVQCSLPMLEPHFVRGRLRVTVASSMLSEIAACMRAYAYVYVYVYVYACHLIWSNSPLAHAALSISLCHLSHCLLLSPFQLILLSIFQLI